MLVIPRGSLRQDWHVLAQITDRGPIVAAAEHFILAQNYLTVVFFGFFHAQWNALKMAAKKALNGRCWAAIIKLMVVWNMNAGPFRSGQWYRSKQEALRAFLATRYYDDPEVQAVLPELARRKGLPCDDRESQEHVYQTCFAGMRSFREDGPVLKLMRWCGLKQVRDFYYPEMPGLKVILSHMAGGHGHGIDAASTSIVGEGTTTAAQAEVEKRQQTKNWDYTSCPQLHHRGKRILS